MTLIRRFTCDDWVKFICYSDYYSPNYPFGDGAISGAWLRALLGLVQLLSLGEVFWNELANPSLDMYKLLAIVAVCLFCGYLFKCLSFLVTEN